MKAMVRLFGTSGIRGPADSLFTNQFCFDLGRTFALFLDKHRQVGKIAVGMDPRPSGPRIKQYFIAGLYHQNREVFDEDICPIPSMNYLLIADSSFAGSAMITGSHNKADLNGVKFFAFKEEILKEHEGEITNIYEEIKEKIPAPKEAPVVAGEKKANKLYIQMLEKLAQTPFPDWKVVVDCGNGAQTEVMPKVLSKLGLQLTTINCDLTKTFLARDTETEGAFGELQKEVIKEKACLGIGFDADGDRVVFIDGEGHFIPGDYSGALISKYGSTKLVVTPINTSQVVEYLSKPVIRTKVGSPYVVAKMKETQADFGFEANGGGFSREVMLSRDGGSTAIKILNLLRQTGKSLSQLVGELPRFYLYRTKVDCPWERDAEVLVAAKARFKGIKTEELDGLKIWTDNTSWILFRSSQNAPEFRVFAEAKTQEEATKLGEDGIKLVREILSN